MMKIFKASPYNAYALLSKPVKPVVYDNYEISSTHDRIINEWILRKYFDENTSIKSKYLDKGKEVEEDAIKLVSSFYGEPMEKNEKYFCNDWFGGFPDVVCPLLDIKCPWSIYHMPNPEKKLKKAYKVQVIIYCHLLGYDSGKVVYVLMNTPEELLDEPQEDYELLDTKDRIVEFEVNKCEQTIELLKEKVELTREIINLKLESYGINA